MAVMERQSAAPEESPTEQASEQEEVFRLRRWTRAEYHRLGDTPGCLVPVSDLLPRQAPPPP